MADFSLGKFARPARVLIAALVTLIGLWGLASGDGSYGGTRTVAAQSAAPGSNVVLIRLDGAIDGVTARFIERGLRITAEQDSELVVLMLNTPGGLLDATRDIVEVIMASEVPVAVYVAPEGAQAASAGTFVGAAANILAMAPTTNIGAASVVSSDGSDLPDTLSRKAMQDAAAFIRSIAETRGRNVSALEDTVFLAKAYSASEAVDLNIADLVAADYASLVVQLDGYEVEMNGETVTLDLGTVTTTTVDMTLLERLLAFISSPNVAFLLVSLGGLGDPRLGRNRATAVLVGRGFPNHAVVVVVLSRNDGSGSRLFRGGGNDLAGPGRAVPGRIFRESGHSRRCPGCEPVVACRDRRGRRPLCVLVCQGASQGEAYQALSKPDGFDQFGRRDRGGFGYLVASRDACRGDIHVEGPGIRGSRERRTLDRRD